ncbi:hypothetical protein G6F22_018572 [Rhizopus arrhizus]|nr:hypothetical protein G6F22_018572 [Rhizopus arrhizus]
MVLLRAVFDHWRTVQANRTSASIQQTLRGKLYDRIVSLGPAWFANQRTGGVMLTVVDGVEQLQTFFGQYLPQVAIAAAAPFAIFAVIAFWDVPTALVFLAAALFALFPGRGAGPAHPEILWPGQGLGPTAGRPRTQPVGQHLLGAVGQPADARHQ